MPNEPDIQLKELVRTAVEAAPPAPDWADVERRLESARRKTSPPGPPPIQRFLLAAAVVLIATGLVGITLWVDNGEEIRVDTRPADSDGTSSGDGIDDAESPVELTFSSMVTVQPPAVVQLCIARASARLDDRLPVLQTSSGPDLLGWTPTVARGTRYLRHQRSMQEILELDDPLTSSLLDASWEREVAAVSPMASISNQPDDIAQQQLEAAADARRQTAARAPDPDRCWTDRPEVRAWLEPSDVGDRPVTTEQHRSDLRCLRAIRSILIVDELATEDPAPQWWEVAEAALVEMDEDGAGPDTSAVLTAIGDARFVAADERSTLLDLARTELDAYVDSLRPRCSPDLSS